MASILSDAAMRQTRLLRNLSLNNPYHSLPFGRLNRTRLISIQPQTKFFSRAATTVGRRTVEPGDEFITPRNKYIAYFAIACTIWTSLALVAFNYQRVCREENRKFNIYIYIYIYIFVTGGFSGLTGTVDISGDHIFTACIKTVA